MCGITGIISNEIDVQNMFDSTTSWSIEVKTMKGFLSLVPTLFPVLLQA